MENETSGEAVKPETKNNPKIQFLNEIFDLASKAFESLRKGFLVILALIFFTFPSLFNNSFEKSGLLDFAKNIKHIKAFGIEMDAKEAEELSKENGKDNSEIKTQLEKAKDGSSEEAKKNIDKALDVVKKSDDENTKILIAAEDKLEQKRANEGWIYVGKTDDNKNLKEKPANFILPDNSPLAIDALKGKKFKIIDASYLRKGSGCPRSTADILTAVRIGEFVTVTEIDTACNIVGGTNSVWAKVTVSSS
jgi:predicted negative regulator of RcsB-dependent stress response